MEDRKAIFQKIADTENGSLVFKDKLVPLIDGVREPYTLFKLNFKYKEIGITLSNEYGVNNCALSSCIIPVKATDLSFEVSTRSHLSTLFSNKKERFKLKTKNKDIASLIKSSAALKVLEDVARETSFSPLITGKHQNNQLNISVAYDLLFSNQTKVLNPLVNFYKELINFLINRGYSV